MAQLKLESDTFESAHIPLNSEGKIGVVGKYSRIVFSYF